MEDGLQGELLNGFLAKLERKVELPGLTEGLADRLTGSELNSLLLEVYRRKAAKITPAELLEQYRRNRLVQPSSLDMIALLELELEVLRFLRAGGFEPVELSPVAAFGSCSVVASVDQHKIITAIRNTEIVADATNALALYIAALLRNRGTAADGRQEHRAVTDGLRLCTVHRHIRTQPFPKGYNPHFKVGCMVSSGRDTGNYVFECSSVVEQLRVLYALLRREAGIERIRLVLKDRKGYDERNPLVDRIYDTLVREMAGEEISREEQPAANAYYTGVQFKVYVTAGQQEWEMADGGFVDWTQRLLGNRKERLLISGFGLEWLYKIRNKEVPL